MFHLHTGHQVQLLQGTQEFFPALIAAMDAAQYTVQIETYIFDFTSSGAEIGDALIRTAKRGLDVRLLVDGVGTAKIPDLWCERFIAAGVQWRIFNPLGALGLLLPSRWRRLHRKLCVLDAALPQAVAFCGGINVLDDFYDPNHGVLAAPRFDFCVRVTGPLVGQVRVACEQSWARAQVPVANVGKLKAAVEGVKDAFMRTRSSWFGKTESLDHTNPDNLSQTYVTKAGLLLRDNFRNRKLIERAYLKAIGGAHQEILIANAYFLPGHRLRKALIAAAGRGVSVKLLLQGKYEYFMQYHAARPIYSALLGAGVQIYEYVPSFLHAKVAVIDADGIKSWATVGSSNLDPLSLLLAREANVVVQEGIFAQELRRRLINAMEAEGLHIDPGQYERRPWIQRSLDYLALGLMRIALWITGNRY